MAKRHADQIARATRGWTRGGLVSSELKKLPDVLRDSEDLFILDRAQQGGRTGLLAVTDERLVFLNARPLRGLEVECYEYGELREARMETPLLGRTRKLVIDLPTDRVTFSGLDSARAERMEEWVQARVGRKGPVPVPGERTRSEVIEELKASLGTLQAVAATPALPRIADEIGRGEEIGPSLTGALGSMPGVLVATDRRLLFASLDPRRPVQEWRYADLRGIKVESYTLAIEAPEPVSVKTASNARADAVADHVRPRLEAPKPKPKPKRKPKAKAKAKAAAPLDVNTADHEALTGRLALTGEQATRAIELRDRQGPFASLDDFIAALELTPHEAVRVRSAAVARAQREREAPTPAAEQPDAGHRPGGFQVG
jgi:Bacterial PH domain